MPDPTNDETLNRYVIAFHDDPSAGVFTLLGRRHPIGVNMAAHDAAVLMDLVVAGDPHAWWRAPFDQALIRAVDVRSVHCVGKAFADLAVVDVHSVED